MTAESRRGAMRGPLRGGACGHARAIAGIVGAGAGPAA